MAEFSTTNHSTCFIANVNEENVIDSFKLFDINGAVSEKKIGNKSEYFIDSIHSKLRLTNFESLDCGKSYNKIRVAEAVLTACAAFEKSEEIDEIKKKIGDPKTTSIEKEKLEELMKIVLLKAGDVKEEKKFFLGHLLEIDQNNKNTARSYEIKQEAILIKNPSNDFLENTEGHCRLSVYSVFYSVRKALAKGDHGNFSLDDAKDRELLGITICEKKEQELYKTKTSISVHPIEKILPIYALEGGNKIREKNKFPSKIYWEDYQNHTGLKLTDLEKKNELLVGGDYNSLAKIREEYKAKKQDSKKPDIGVKADSHEQLEKTAEQEIKK